LRSLFVRRAALLRLLLDRTGEAATKALRFAPRLANIVAEASEPGCYVDDDECEHGYFSAWTIKRPIWRSALSDSLCNPWSATYCSTARVARCRLDSA
jgi:hypothetical protein